MTRLIGILEKKGLVIKQTCVDKRLVNKIQITKKGKKLKDLISPFIQQSRNKFFNGLTNEELSECIRILLKIQNNLR